MKKNIFLTFIMIALCFMFTGGVKAEGIRNIQIQNNGCVTWSEFPGAQSYKYGIVEINKYRGQTSDTSGSVVSLLQQWNAQQGVYTLRIIAYADTSGDQVLTYTDFLIGFDRDAARIYKCSDEVEVSTSEAFKEACENPFINLVKLTSNINTTEKIIFKAYGINRTLDLNGYTLNIDEEFIPEYFSVNDLTMTDTSKNKTGTFICTNSILPINYNNGEDFVSLIINGGTYIINYDTVFENRNYFNLVINDGVFKSNKTLFKFNNSYAGEVTLKNLTFEAKNNSIENIYLSQDKYSGTKVSDKLAAGYELLYFNKDNNFSRVTSNTFDHGYSGLGKLLISNVYNDIRNADIKGNVNKTYTGSSIKQKLTIVLNGRTLIENKDYKTEYNSNINAGTASLKIKGIGNYTGTRTKYFTINKANNPMTVTFSNKKVKYKKVKKKAQTVNVITVKNAQGIVSYKKISGKKKITVNSRTGKITVKKKTKKGTYKVKIKVSTNGNRNYKALSKTITVTIKVK